MNLFSDYIQPVTLWLESHPHWALFLTFLIAFAESLAVIGSIVPGTVTMTAIGILAGSGVMRVDLTLIAAILGAVAGDGGSYLLGYVYREKLHAMWPFSRYPNWLIYGKSYFDRHGGKSVLIGRFVGPLRSIIPVIAGMLQMNHWRFFIANVISGIGWACLYVLPGVLIGAASNDLSPESATRLFVFVLVAVGAIWLLSICLKILFIKLNQFLRVHLHDFWTWSGKHPHLATIIRKLTPPGENHHYQTTMLCLCFILSTLFFLIISGLTLQHSWLAKINEPVHLFLQSLHTYWLDVFFIALDEVNSTLSIISLAILIILIAIYHKDSRSLSYWLSLLVSCSIIVYLSHSLIQNPRPEGLIEVRSTFSYPAMRLTFATALLSLLLFYLNRYHKCRYTQLLNFLLPIILILCGLAPLYLGDHWLSDVIGAYFAGLSIALVHWLLYRRQEMPSSYQPCLAPALLAILVLASSFSFWMRFEQSYRSHQPFLAQYVFTDHRWWQQQRPILPIHRTNRIGKNISVFNIQYAGKLSDFENNLLAQGWQPRNESFFNLLLKRFSGKPDYKNTPLMAQLYLNRKPVLIMTYQPANGGPAQILRLWRSNYHLQHLRQPIWLGTIAELVPSKPQNIKYRLNDKDLFLPISSALTDFKQRTLLVYPAASNQSINLLLIKQPHGEK
ncbi:VTT domain-containing protein [Legionella dresdenensis]|uniref:VTT domain-containing protein n=1 Tax=Legionella dresdenensis TaxID=450200 RepID=A0ABV8CCD4_9GAMM